MLRIGCSVLPSVLDRDQPLRLLQWENIDAHLQLYEPLLGYAGVPPRTAGTPESLGLEPLVAASWIRSDNGRTYTFELNRGIRSASGNELTAEDVCWAWERSIGVGSIGAWIARNLALYSAEQACEHIRPAGRYTVRFDLPRPTTILPHLLTVIVPTIFDSAEARAHATADDPWALRWLRTNSAGFGPYTVERCTETSFVLRANPNYRRGPLPFDQVEYVAIPDAEARLDALRSGEVDVATDLDTSAGRYGDVEVRSVPTTWQTKLGLNVTTHPLTELRLRQAIAAAIPYDRIVADGYLGNARTMDSCLNRTVWGFAPVGDLIRHDPAMATRLVAELGELPPIEFYYHDELPQLARTAAIITESLESAGIPINPVLIDGAEHSMRRIARDMPMYLESDGPITIDGRYALGHDVNPPLDGVFDFTGYHSDAIDERLTAGLGELDDDRVRRLLAEVQQIAVRDLPWVPLAEQMFVFGTRPRVDGYRWYPLSRLRLRDLRERP